MLWFRTVSSCMTNCSFRRWDEASEARSWKLDKVATSASLEVFYAILQTGPGCGLKIGFNISGHVKVQEPLKRHQLVISYFALIVGSPVAKIKSTT